MLITKCYVRDGSVSTQDLELGNYVDGSSSSKSLCKSLQKILFFTISRPGPFGGGEVSA